ncbi:MAG: hypothetical protein NXI20_24615 [bacterium]|nr:hypothetical protein [bacterium]
MIGILSILASVYGFFTKSDSHFNYFGIFIGLSIIVSVYADKGSPKQED